MNAPHHFRRHAREYGVLVVLAAAAIALVAVLATRSSDGDGTTGSALPGAGGLELSIRGLAEVPQRTFRWEALGGSWQREESP
jgi:hypothetical protein